MSNELERKSALRLLFVPPGSPKVGVFVTSIDDSFMFTMVNSGIDVSITMATCCRGPMLREALDHLLPQAEAVPFRTEFVIVDDGSTDGTPEVLLDFKRRAGVPVTLVRGEGCGIAAARNLSVAHSNGTWLACCDDDQIAAPNWLFSLYEAALRSSADFVGGSMSLHLPGNCALGQYGPRARRLLGECGLNRKEGRFEPGATPATNNVLMRRDVVRRLSAFDTSFTQGNEDTDLFTRARAAGHTLWFTPRAHMLHVLTERRVTPEGLRWTAMRIGSGDTRVLHLQHRHVAPVRHAARRTAILLLRDLPQLAFAALRRRRTTALDVKCSIWYTEGVLRSLPVLMRPRSRTSRSFLRHMDFRHRDGERAA